MMHTLLMDLLVLGQAGDNRFKLNNDYFALDSVIKKARSIVKHSAITKNIEIETLYGELASKNLHCMSELLGD